MGIHDRDYHRNRRRDDDDDEVSGEGAWREDVDEVDDDIEEADGDGEQALDDPEAPDPSDRDDSDEPALIACPKCKKRVSEESEQCRFCGYWFTDTEIEKAERPWWIYVGMVLAVVLALLYALRP